MLGTKARSAALVAGLGWAVLFACPKARANDSGFSELAAAVRALSSADGFEQLGAEVPITPGTPEPRKARLEAALAALERAPELSRQSAAGRYAHSRLLEQLGRIEEALSALPQEAGLPERVAIDVRARRAQHLAALGRCDEAQALWVLLEDALPPAQIARARAKCVAVTPDGTRKPVPEPPLTLEARLQRAEKLTEEGRGEEALALIDQVRAKAVPKAERARFTHVRGMALFRMRTRYTEAARVLAAAAALKGPTAEEDAFSAARALARADQDRAAIRAFHAFAKRYATSRRASEALYLAAWLEMRNGKTEADKRRGEDALARWLESPHAKAQPTLAAEALFDLGMRSLARAEGTLTHAQVAREGSPTPLAASPEALTHYALASQRFGRYAEITTGCLERGRGFYWGARAELAQGHRPQAVALYAEAVKSEPLCWYALLGRKQLAALNEPVPDPYASATVQAGASPTSNAAPDAGLLADVPPADAQPPVFAAPLPPDVAFYAGLGFDAEAVAALRKQEAVVQASVPPGLGLPTLVRAYHALSEYARPRALVHQAPAGLLTAAPGAHNAWAFSAAYARPHAAFVQARARVDGVDPELIYAVMLKESVFDPSVTSNADAIGLMQLLPGTGKAVGKSLGLTVTRQTLFDPRANIVLGTRLLKQLLARYSGQMPLAVAAYNAGEHRVDAWLARARKKAQGAPIALDRFVEDIPIDQTRNYVRRVMAFYARYELLQLALTNEPNPPVFTLPDSVF